MESWLISERGKKLSTNIAESTCRRWCVSVSLWKCSTKTLHYAPSESWSRRKTFAEIRWKKWFWLCSKMGRMWLYRGRIGKERDGKLGINIDHVTKHSRIDVREARRKLHLLGVYTSLRRLPWKVLEIFLWCQQIWTQEEHSRLVLCFYFPVYDH